MTLKSKILNGVAGFAALAVMSVSTSFAHETGDHSESNVTLIHAGTVMAVPGESTLSDVTIVVQDGMIMEIIDGYIEHDGAQIIDLKDDYVLISLYIDDRKELPKEAQFDFKFDSGRVKTIENIGQKWGTFQSLNFNTASQPFYVLLSPDLEVLNSPIQQVDADTYREWLKTGLVNYRSLAQNRIELK